MSISPRPYRLACVGMGWKHSLNRAGPAMAVLAACLAAPLWAQPQPQTKAASSAAQRMEILLDRREGDAWRSVDPGLVFAQDDRVRFRYRASFAGYLYVLNQSTSGKFETLFPRQDTGEENRIEAGKSTLFPRHRVGSGSLARPATTYFIGW